MTLVRWEPFRDLLSFQDRIGRFMPDFYSRGLGDDVFGTWVPPVDIFERGDDLVVRAELPGVEKDNIDVRVEDGTLVLRGERKSESELNEKNAYRLERAHGAFTRSFALPTTVDPSRITATFKDGVLELVLPKAEEAKPKKIKIKAA